MLARKPVTVAMKEYIFNPIYKGRLSRRLLFWVIAISSFFALLATCFQLYITFDKDKSGILSNFEFINNSYVPSIASSSYALEENTVNLLIQGILSIQDITYIEVWEGQSKWLTMGELDNGKNISREYDLVYTDRWGETLHFGKLVVQASLKGLYQRLWQRAFVLLGTNMIKTIFTSLCIYLLFQWMVTRHLSTIATYSGKLDLDRLSEELTLGRKKEYSDEFDDLIKSINDMRSRLAKAIADQRRLISIVENTTDMISTATPDRRIRYLNTAGLKLLGWDTGNDYMGKEIADVHPPWSSELINSTAIPYAIRHGVWTGETALLTHDGKEIPASQVIMAHKSQDGKLEYLSTIIRDISDIRRAEKKLHIMEKSIAASNSAIAICDPEGVMTYVNKSFLTLWGYDSENEVLGRQSFEFWEDPETLKQLTIDLGFRKGWLGEMTALRKDNSTFFAHVSAVAVKNEKGELICLMSSSLDITARKKAEEELQKAHKDLEKRVEERTLELQKTHYQLLHAEKLSAVGRLSASIAHEFNNPLQGVMSVINGIKRRIDLDDADAELIDMALRECNRMKEFIKDLQDFNRPTSGRLAFINLHEAIDSTLLLTKKDFKNRNITVKKDYASKLPPLMVIGDQIKQVLLNLLNNASDACDDEGKITISTALKENDVILRIQDNGKGISPENLEHVFEPFFTTKEGVKGTGLGLSVSYGIIKRHGGKIEVESETNKGATFTVTMPIKGESDAEQIDTVG